MYKKVMESVNYLKTISNKNPKIAIILGSGLGDLVNFVDNKVEISYKDIPNFPVVTVKGHDGKLIYGNINGVDILIMQGRFHYYEGYSMKEVTYPMYVFKMLGIEKVIVSNAAGGINSSFSPGSLMLINDFINFMVDNPLIGANDEKFGTRFPDMSEPYKKYLLDIAKKCSTSLNIDIKEGTYIGFSGPCYETKAEIRAFKTLGADAVGMSTVPETIVGNYLNIDMLGISCITNMATGISKTAHSHEEVVNVAKETGEKFCKLIVEIIKNL